MTDAEEFILTTYEFRKELSCNNINRVSLVQSTINKKLYIRRDILKDKHCVYQLLKTLNLQYISKIENLIYDGNTIVIEEYIDGETLEECLKYKKQTIDINLIIEQLLKVMKTLHDNNIIHQDIKAENIILKNDGTLFLIDFAIAKIYSPNLPLETEILGTIGSAPPEQFGLAPTDQRSDIYSFGRLCEFILNNTSYLNTKPQNIWNYIIEKCTDFEPDKRFQNVDEILSILKNPDFLYDNSEERIIPFLHTEPAMCLQLHEEQKKTVALPWNTFDNFQLHIQSSSENISLTIENTGQHFDIFSNSEILSCFGGEYKNFVVEVIFFDTSILFALDVRQNVITPLNHTKISKGVMAKLLFCNKKQLFTISETYFSLSGFSILGNEEVLFNRETLNSYPLKL